MMTVQQLMAELKDMPKNAEVRVRHEKDPKGTRAILLIPKQVRWDNDWNSAFIVLNEWM